MKKSIFIASFILLLVVGWIGSGQFSNNVIAQDDNTETISETERWQRSNNITMGLAEENHLPRGYF